MIRPLCETRAGPVHSLTRRDLRKGFEPPMTIADQVTGSTIAGTGKPAEARPAEAKPRSAAPAITLPAIGERELRLDLFRGLALWLIFVDHLPPSLLTWFTIRNYGFSDATEIFIFISGYTAAFVYGKIGRAHV